MLSPDRQERNGYVLEQESAGVNRFHAEYYDVPIVERIIAGGPKVFILPGWGGYADPEDPTLAAFNMAGFSVIAAGTPYPNERRQKRFLPPTVQLTDDADAFTELIHAKTQVDERHKLIGQSYGGLTSILVAHQIPEKVDHLTLINPAIRHKIDSAPFLSVRYAGNMAGDGIKELLEKGRDGLVGAKRVLEEATANPVDSVHRAFSIIHANKAIRKAYHASKNGVKITLITGTGDGIFHYDKTEQRFREGFLLEYQNEVADDGLIFDQTLERFMPRFVREPGGHDLKKTGAEFVEFITTHWALTEQRFAQLAA